MLKVIICLAFFSFTLPQRQILIPVPRNSNTPEAVACTLSAPVSFDAKRTSSSTADLSWSAVSGASAYKLRIYIVGNLRLVSETTQKGLSKTINGLQSGVAYRFELASICSDQVVSRSTVVKDI